jgi:hypothetical protein
MPVLMKEEMKTVAIIVLTLAESLSYPIMSMRYIVRLLMNILMPMTSTTTTNTRA